MQLTRNAVVFKKAKQPWWTSSNEIAGICVTLLASATTTESFYRAFVLDPSNLQVRDVILDGLPGCIEVEEDSPDDICYHLVQFLAVPQHNVLRTLAFLEHTHLDR